MARDALPELRIQAVLRHQVAVEQLRVQVRDHAARVDLRAVGKEHAAGAALAHQHLRYRGIGDQFHAAPTGLGGHRLGDRSHAADRMAPGAAPAIHFAEAVVQQHVAAAGRVRARIVADHRIEAEHRLDRIGLEPAVEQVAGALGDQVQQVAPLGHRQPAHPVAGGQGAQHLAHAAADVRRGLQHDAAQHVCHAFQPVVVLGQPLCIARRELRHFRLGRRQPATHLQEGCVRQRQEVGQRPLQHAQAVLGEPQVADHGGIEQADRVGQRRVAKAGMEGLGHRGATEHRTPFQHPHLQPGRRQVAGAGQSVVATTDDQCIERRVRHSSLPVPMRPSG